MSLLVSARPATVQRLCKQPQGRIILQQHFCKPGRGPRRLAAQIVVEPAAFFLRQKPMQKTYEQQIQECQVLLLVDFCTVWCGPCQLQAKVINNVTPLYTGKVEFMKVDTEKHAAISAQYGIHSLPTLILFRGGEVVERKEGLMNEIDLRLWLQKHL